MQDIVAQYLNRICCREESYLLQENTDLILQEDGSKILI